MNMSLPLIALVALSTFCVGQDAENKEPQKLLKLRASWRTSKENAIRPIRERHLIDLASLKTKLTIAGKLDDAVLVRDEIDKVLKETKGEKPDQAPKRPGELVSLRTAYDRDVSRICKEKDTIYLTALKAKQKKFSGAGNLDAALAVGEEIKGVKKHIDPSPIDPSRPPWTEKTLIGTIWKTDDGARLHLKEGHVLGTEIKGKQVQGNTWYFKKPNALEFVWQGGKYGKVTATLSKDGTSAKRWLKDKQCMDTLRLIEENNGE